MQTLESVIKEVESIALAEGASTVKQIDPKDVVVAQWVRNKCQFGCQYFGKRFTCPPYAPTPDETLTSLKSYHRALLVEFPPRYISQMQSGKDMIHNALSRMERTAFLSGYERAFGYKAGPCRLCKECPAEKLESPNLFCKKECKYPKEARPSMEAAGIDVYSTAHQAGFELNVVRSREEPFKSFGLLMLE